MSAQQRAVVPAPQILPQQVFERLAQPQGGLILLDVRSPYEWMMDGIIEGSTRIPMEELAEQLEAGAIPKDAEVIVHCAHGVRSANVGAYMLYYGWTNVRDRAGDIDRWKRSGLPVTHLASPA
ncbi:MAG: rhodanese-like domain-containing protein [Anaerolineae bacterium]|nr:rhodanese-like domain-containing protein [Anaerolineae bacterium]